MSKKESLKKAQKKYLSEKDQLILRLSATEKEQIVTHAKSMGESTNAFVARAIETAMQQEPAIVDKTPTTITLRFKKGTRDKINDYAKLSGEKTSEFLLRAINDAIENDIK